MEPRTKIWIERDGRIALSSYRARLLSLIDETGSLSEAANRMQISYRRAWGKLREIESNLGLRLVESVSGGPGGGGSRLTDEGRRMLQAYENFRRAAEEATRREFRRFFPDEPA
ncbi:MAG: LysR family transcriptional regulator [Chloroflexi bacterium]|nr:LysR family transcriptional regulator [Chloroflexota bacterium]